MPIEWPSVAQAATLSANKSSFDSANRAIPKARNRAIPVREPNNGEQSLSSPRLHIEAGSKGDTWTVSGGIVGRGKNKLRLRVRANDSGYPVSWRKGDRERYLCQLTPDEWKAAKRLKEFGEFIYLITKKMEFRINQAEGEKKKRIEDLSKDMLACEI